METETVPTLHPWLALSAAGSPPDPGMVQLCVSQGARRPEALVEMVARMVGDKLSWSCVATTSISLCEATLAALAHRRGEALAYAHVA